MATMKDKGNDSGQEDAGKWEEKGPASDVAARLRPSATEAAARKLATQLEALADKEEAAFAALKTANTRTDKPLALGQKLVELTGNHEELQIKAKQLRSLAESVTDENAQAEFSRVLDKCDDAERRHGIAGLRQRIAIEVTDALVARPRARRGEAENSHEGGARTNETTSNGEDGSNLYAPNRIEHHDVLVIAPAGVHSREQFYRFPVIKNPAGDAREDAEKRGEYRDQPELLDAFDYGQRRALAVARPQDWGPASVRATQRGPAFSTLPLKPEPNSAAGPTGESSQCYLINTQNLNFRNAWTAEEWNDTPGGVDLPPAPSANQNHVEALLAGPQGKVFRLVLRSIADWEPGTEARIVATTRDGERDLGSVESVNLRPHMEVWHQLRGGTAMGRVYFNDANGPRVIPLVNITTLTRE